MKGKSYAWIFPLVFHESFPPGSAQRGRNLTMAKFPSFLSALFSFQKEKEKQRKEGWPLRFPLLSGGLATCPKGKDARRKGKEVLPRRAFLYDTWLAAWPYDKKRKPLKSSIQTTRAGKQG